MADLKTAIRAHCVLNWAEVCSPAQLFFCLLVAVVFVHPPAHLLLMSAPLCHFSGGLLKEMLMKETSIEAFFFFFLLFKSASQPISADMFFCSFCSKSLPYADVFLVFSTCCLALMHCLQFQS